MVRVTKNTVTGSTQDPTSIELFPKAVVRARDRGLAPARKPTTIGVAPPSSGTPRPLRSGDSGRYSLVRGKTVR